MENLTKLFLKIDNLIIKVVSAVSAIIFKIGMVRGHHRAKADYKIEMVKNK